MTNERRLTSFLSGSTYNGAWDFWYGPSGREGAYNFNSVKTSSTGAALASINRLANTTQMLRLREESDVKCSSAEGNTAANKCQPLVEPCLFNIAKDPCEQRNLASV